MHVGNNSKKNDRPRPKQRVILFCTGYPKNIYIHGVKQAQFNCLILATQIQDPFNLSIEALPDCTYIFGIIAAQMPLSTN